MQRQKREHSLKNQRCFGETASINEKRNQHHITAKKELHQALTTEKHLPWDAHAVLHCLTG